MLRLLMVFSAGLMLVSNQVAGDEKPKDLTLAEAVKDFNQRAQKDATGRTQPPLTEDEAVAAIRGWIREQIPVTDEVYKVYQTIADTKKLPKGARLTFITKWTVKLHPDPVGKGRSRVRYHNLEFDVWWVDLSIMTGPNTVYTYRLRDQKLRCRSLGKRPGAAQGNRDKATGHAKPGAAADGGA